MNKTNQFGVKVQYETPSCKAVGIQTRRAILSISDPVGERNPEGLYNLGDDNGVNDNSNDWGY